MSREGSRREPAPVKHPLAFSRARALQEHLLFVSWCHPWLSSPGPSLGPPAHPALSPWLFSTHQDALSQLQDSVHGFGGHRATHCGHGAELPPKVLDVQAKLLLCETRNPPLGTSGFSHPWLEPTLQSGKVQRGQNHFPRRVEFTDLSSPPCVVFSRAAIKNHEYGFNISNWEHLPSPINTLPCQPWPEG